MVNVTWFNFAQGQRPGEAGLTSHGAESGRRKERNVCRLDGYA